MVGPVSLGLYVIELENVILVPPDPLSAKLVVLVLSSPLIVTIVSAPVISTPGKFHILPVAIVPLFIAA